MGTVLLAPVGMWALTAFRRRRQRTATRTAAWIAAMTCVGIGIIGLTLVAFTALPDGSLRQIQHAADSASAESYKKPPPAWVERMAPGTTAKAARGPVTPASLRTPIFIWSAGVGLLLTAGVVGSIGWAAAMLCGFGIGGRWPNGPAHDQFDDASMQDFGGAVAS